MSNNQHRATLIVVGTKTYLGEEVARFGRALGHRVIAVVDENIPDPIHPWMMGVHWIESSLPDLHAFYDGSSFLVFYCDQILAENGIRTFAAVQSDRPRALLNQCEELPEKSHRRFIYRSFAPHPFLISGLKEETRRMEARLMKSPLRWSILRFPLLYGPDRPASALAMSMFRIAGLPTLPVETGALAMLRAGLEPDLEGVFEPREIKKIGDVMIAQT